MGASIAQAKPENDQLNDIFTVDGDCKGGCFECISLTRIMGDGANPSARPQRP